MSGGRYIIPLAERCVEYTKMISGPSVEKSATYMFILEIKSECGTFELEGT